jgi:hypothetical protein
MNDREITIITKDKGRVIIPKYAVKQIEPVTEAKYSNGEYVEDNNFSEKYIIANSALLFEKHKTYINTIYYFIWSVNYAFTENFSIGASGAGYLPLLLNANMNFQINRQTFIGSDIHFGSLWIEPIYFGNAIIKLTTGNNQKNLTFGAGITGGFDNSYRGYSFKNSSNVYAYTLDVGVMGRISNALALTGELWAIIDYQNKQYYYSGGIGFKTLKNKRRSFTFALMPVVFPYTKYNYYPYHSSVKAYQAYPIPVITYTGKF